ADSFSRPCAIGKRRTILFGTLAIDDRGVETQAVVKVLQGQPDRPRRAQLLYCAPIKITPKPTWVLKGRRRNKAIAPYRPAADAGAREGIDEELIGDSGRTGLASWNWDRIEIRRARNRWASAFLNAYSGSLARASKALPVGLSPLEAANERAVNAARREIV